MKKFLISLLILFLSAAVSADSRKLDQVIDTAAAVQQIARTVQDTVVSTDAGEFLDLMKDYAVNKGKAAVQKKVADFINTKVTGEREKQTLLAAFDKLGKEDINSGDLVEITKAFQTSALKKLINKNLDEKEAALVTKALDEFAVKGTDGALDVAQKELNDLINKHIKGDEAKKSLSDALQKIRDNRLDEINVGKVTKDVTQGALNDWVDRQDWNQSQKDKAKTLVNAGLTDGVDGVSDSVRQMLVDKVTKELGERAGEIVGKVNQAIDKITAVDQISETVRNSLSADEAEELIGLIQDYAINKGKEKVQDKVEDFIRKKITGEREQQLLRAAFDKLGKEDLTGQDLKDIALCFQTSAIKNLLNKNLGKNEAALVGKALDEFVARGVDGALDVGQEELNRLIGKYVKGENAQKSLTDAVQKIRDGRYEDIDLGKVTKDVTQGAVNDWIDRQDWNQSQKDKAKTLVDAGLTDGVDGITEAVETMIVDKVTKELGEEAGTAMRNIIDQLTDYDPSKEGIRESGATIAHAAMVKTIEEQYAKICKKYPLLGKLMDQLGLKGDFLDAAAKIKQVLANAKSVKDLIVNIAKIAVDLLKTIAKKLVDFAKQMFVNIVNQLGKIAQKLIQKCLDMLMKFVKEITQEIIDELTAFAKQLAKRVMDLTQKVVYVVNQVTSTVQTIVDTVKKVKETTGALFNKGWKEMLKKQNPGESPENTGGGSSETSPSAGSTPDTNLPSIDNILPVEGIKTEGSDSGERKVVDSSLIGIKRPAVMSKNNSSVTQQQTGSSSSGSGGSERFEQMKDKIKPQGSSSSGSGGSERFEQMKEMIKPQGSSSSGSGGSELLERVKEMIKPQGSSSSGSGGSERFEQMKEMIKPQGSSSSGSGGSERFEQMKEMIKPQGSSTGSSASGGRKVVDSSLIGIKRPAVMPENKSSVTQQQTGSPSYTKKGIADNSLVSSEIKPEKRIIQDRLNEIVQSTQPAKLVVVKPEEPEFQPAAGKKPVKITNPGLQPIKTPNPIKITNPGLQPIKTPNPIKITNPGLQPIKTPDPIKITNPGLRPIKITNPGLRPIKTPNPVKITNPGRIITTPEQERQQKKIEELRSKIQNILKSSL